MASTKTTVFMSGKVYWAKILGDPRPNYGGDAREWAFEFEPDEEGLKELKKHKLTDRLKDKYEDRGKFITLRKPEFNREGDPNKPIRVYDAEDNEWDQAKLIGNGSHADLKLDIRNYGVGKKSGMYPIALRITELVEYQSNEFGDFNKKEPSEAAPKKDTFKKDFGIDLDDEIPL